LQIEFERVNFPNAAGDEPLLFWLDKSKRTKRVTFSGRLAFSLAFSHKEYNKISSISKLKFPH
jgi:hypothetical protein